MWLEFTLYINFLSFDKLKCEMRGKKINRETLWIVVAMQMAHLEECWWYKGGQVSLGQSKARLSEKLISKEAEEVARHSS